jgi:hypothetical protein
MWDSEAAVMNEVLFKHREHPNKVSNSESLLTHSNINKAIHGLTLCCVMHCTVRQTNGIAFGNMAGVLLIAIYLTET